MVENYSSSARSLTLVLCTLPKVCCHPGTTPAPTPSAPKRNPKHPRANPNVSTMLKILPTGTPRAVYTDKLLIKMCISKPVLSGVASAKAPQNLR